MNNWTMTLRLIIGAGHIILPFLFGLLASNPWIILPMGVVFVIGYIGGKWYQWSNHIKTTSPLKLIIDIALTWIVQLIVVSLFFFLGLGIGRIFGLGPIADSITSLDLIILSGFAVISFTTLLFIIKGEDGNPYGNILSELSKYDTDGKSSDIDELIMSDKKITIDNFFRSRHYSVSDHTNKALTQWPTDDGKKISRDPIAATETMLAETEQRLGFKLPETLRQLYKIRNGGSLPTYYVPAKENPQNTYDDWLSAFTGYNDLYALKHLFLLIKDYEEYFEPEFDDEADKENWYPGSDKIVVLAKMYGNVTALDYNKNVSEPELLLLNLDCPPENRVCKSYKDFDTFFADLRIEQDEDTEDADNDYERLSPDGFDPDNPQHFWANSTANSSNAISDEKWIEQENRLGFRLPKAFKPLYAELDGGVCAYPYHPDAGQDEYGRVQSIFPGELYTNKKLLPLSSWITLQEMSNRLDFRGLTPYTQIHEEPGRLLVIAASYDQALMLDYRNGPSPDILFTPDLMKPKTTINLQSPEQFLSNLRQKQNLNAQYGFEATALGDERLSPRVANSETFWIKAQDRNGASDKSIEQAGKSFEKEIPSELANLMKKQNGGMVRFRFAPPALHHSKMAGPVNEPSQKLWADMFPGGIWPVEDWISFSQFRTQNKTALNQNTYEDLIPNIDADSDFTERLIVIGAKDKTSLTILDLSESYFHSTPYLFRIDYDQTSDKYKIAIAPIDITHYTNGVFAILRARRDEL